MATIDITQYRRKLKHPLLRKWTKGKGEWEYITAKGTKRNLQNATKLRDTGRTHHVVAYRGKEYPPDEFLRQHPKFRQKKPIQKKAPAKKKRHWWS